MKFRRQAVHEVEAQQFHGFNGYDIQSWAYPHVAYCNDNSSLGEFLQVFSSSNILNAYRGDWVIKDQGRIVIMTDREFRESGFTTSSGHLPPPPPWQTIPDGSSSSTTCSYDSTQVAALSQTLSDVLSKIEAIMSDMSVLSQQVHQNSSVIQSAIVLINGLREQLVAAQNDPAAIQALIDELTANDQALAAAVVANTVSMPATVPAPEPAPAPVVEEPAPVVEEPAPVVEEPVVEAPVVEEPAPVVEEPVVDAPVDAPVENTDPA